MENQERLRVAVVGCGYQGRILAEAVTRTTSMRLVAGADPVAEAAAAVASLAADVRTYSSVDALLADSQVDAILVATPHHVLQPVALSAIRAGKHVMVEKPIALNGEQAEEIQQAVAQAGICYLPGYSMRFSFGRTVRQLLDAGVVGDVRAMTGSIGTGPMDDGWIAKPAYGGGPLLYVGSHLVDLALWYAGDEPLAVEGHVKYRADTGADDTSAFQIHFARGALAQLLVTQSAPTFFVSFEVLGQQGRINLRVSTFLQFEIEVISTAVATYAHPTIIRPRIFRDNIAAMCVPELEEFAQAIHDQRQPAITVTDGRRVLRVLDAVVRSAESGHTWRLTG